MNKELYVKAMEDLYNKMKSLAYEFNIKKEDLDTANKIYANNMASQKIYIKSEQVPKKAKIVLPAPKKSLFIGTPLDVSSKKIPSLNDTNNASFTTPDLNMNGVSNTDSGYSSVTSLV